MKRRGPDDRLCHDRFFAPLHRKPVLLILYYSLRPGGYFHEPKNSRMRLSVVFELLLVFLFLAFAAARVIDPARGVKNVAKENKKTTTLRQGPPNRYCACTSRMCNCCRDFSLPVVPIKGPGCASIMYVQRDTMMVTMSFGDRVLSNTTISGKTPKPICMALPGGISQFCGRVYGISRKGDQFRACLGLELRALDDIEAALRVSCFKFGPKGVRLESAPPVPAETGGKDPEEEDEDDYDLDDDEDDDLIGFGVDDEDDGASSEDNEVDSDSVDYTGFSVLGEDILGTFFSDDSGSSSAKKKKPSKKTAKPQSVVSQVVIPKVSTTTKRPILPIRRRSTVKPLSSVTKRPLLNRVTKRPVVSTNRPQIIQRPSPQITLQSTFLPVSPTVVTKNELDKNIVTKSPSTVSEVPTTMPAITTENSLISEKVQTVREEINQESTVVTEEPITFTIPTQRTEVMKNDIKLPQTDLAKVEAVAAIAQQDVTSGVISTSSLSSEETEKPMEAVTVKYEKITPAHVSLSTPSYISGNMEKISSIKFIPTTVVTSRPSAELEHEDDFSNENTDSEVATNSELELPGITIHQHNMVSTLSNEHKKDSTEDNSKHDETVEKNNIEKNSLTEKGNLTISLKKQPVKNPVKKDDKEEEQEEEEEGEEDILEGVLSDDDDSDNEEIEENDDSPVQTSSNKNKVEASDDEEEAEDDDDDDDEDDILGETIETSQKVKPSKVSIKKKPASDAGDEEEEEEEEEEEDILDVLGDDDEEEESDDDDDDDEPEKENNEKKPTTQITTVKIKKPTTPATVQTRKPVSTSEKLSSPTTTERVTEKIFIYKEPTEKVTDNIIIYKEPENKIPDKVFIYKEPENQINQKTTEKVIFYKEPVQQSVTEKFVIYNEPEEKPAFVLKDDSTSSEETKDDSEEEEKVENDDENSSEEEFEDDNHSEKHTLVASIVKPEFSNKYATHDLAETEDLDIEDSEDDGNDFEEDRKLKGSGKKPIAKSPTNKKSEIQANKPKILSLTDLIGQRNKYDHLKDDKPISSSRTHRRMNLDRLLQV